MTVVTVWIDKGEAFAQKGRAERTRVSQSRLDCDIGTAPVGDYAMATSRPNESLTFIGLPNANFLPNVGRSEP
jgi:hypothetical protein